MSTQTLPRPVDEKDREQEQQPQYTQAERAAIFPGWHQTVGRISWPEIGRRQ